MTPSPRFAMFALLSGVASAVGEFLRRRRWLTDLLELFALSSLAIAQPIYDRVARQIDFLTDPRVSAGSLGMLLLFLSVALPVGLATLEVLVGLVWRAARPALHLSMIICFLALLALPIANRVPFLAAWCQLLVSLLAAAIGGWCYVEYPRVRWAMLCCLPGALIFPGVFLWRLPASEQPIVWSREASAPLRPCPVVVVVFDEFSGQSLLTPEREIDAERFPNFAELARESLWFRNAATVSPSTFRAVPSLLTGNYPVLAPSQPRHFPQNLFSTLMFDGGYEYAAFEPATVLALEPTTPTGEVDRDLWSQTRQVLDTVWRVYLFHVVPPDYCHRLPEIPRSWFGFRNFGPVQRGLKRGAFRYNWDDRRDEQFEHFLTCINTDRDSMLYFGHFFVPHVPWCYLPSGNYYAPDRSELDMSCLETDTGRMTDELGAVQNQQRHLLQVMFVDRLLGKLLERLTEQGLRERCLLIVTADHGISFRTGALRRDARPENADEILSIPLFVKLPFQQSGEIIDRPVESVDILPTIAEVVGLSLKPTAGRSLLDESHPYRTVFTCHVTDGEPKTFDVGIIPRSPTPRAIRARFGPASEADRFFQIGPLPELIGLATGQLPQATSTAVEIEFSQYGDVASEQSPGFVPCLFQGRLPASPADGPPVVLAVAVNGVIRATTRTYTQAGYTDRWSVLVPEGAFRPGKNDVRFYTVNGPDHRLTPCVSKFPVLPQGD